MNGKNLPFPIWWIQTMEYLRTVSGTVYSDQLKSYALEKIKEIGATVDYNENQDIVEFLNSFSKDESGYGYIKNHTLTGEIYTIPYMRKDLDACIKKCNPDYMFNGYLYEKVFGEAPGGIYIWNEKLWDEILTKNTDKKEISIDFSLLKKDDTPICIEQFNLSEIYEYAAAGCPDYCIKTINAQNTVFTGKCNIGFDSKMSSFPEITDTCDFSGATFADNVDIYNLVFLNETRGKTLIDFRNTRCFKSVKIRNVRFCGTTDDCKITFEDSRISENFEIINSDLDNGCLYCFQTVFGDFLMEPGISEKSHCIVLNNISFGDSARIDFVDTEIGKGCIKICNMSNLPTTDLCFAPEVEQTREICPDIKLEIMNCNIHSNLTISNVAELSFEKSKNFGRIIDDNKWRDTQNKPDRIYRRKTRGLGGTVITNKLLLAVYNYGLAEKQKNLTEYNKAKDFVMLKENFVSQGMYDEEDTAFLLYMEFKPYMDSFNKSGEQSKIHKSKKTSFLYNILYASGKYGISPTRVGVVLTLTVLLFSVLYFLISIISDNDAFSIGNVVLSDGGTFNMLAEKLTLLFPQIESYSIYNNLIGSFLYSLQNIIPFVSQFEPFDIKLLILSAVENFIGTFMVGYFSVAVIRKTLR